MPALVTLADVKTYLQITHTDDDTLLNLLIGYVSDAAENMAGVFFSSTAVTRAFDGGELNIMLKSPIISITSVTDDGGAGSIVAATLYDFDPVTGELYLKSGLKWTAGRREFQVIYQSGYSAVPASVVLAAQGLIAKYHDGRDPDLASKSLGDWSTTNDPEIKAFKRLVMRYGRVRM